MAGIYKKGQEYLISAAVKEATYGAEAAMSRKLILARPTPVIEVPEIEFNENFSNGLEGPDASQVIAKYWTWSPEPAWPKVDDLALWLAYTLGTPTSALADEIAYMHTYAESALDAALPSFSILETWDKDAVSPAIINRYSGGLVKSLKISWTANKPLSIQPQCVFASCTADTGSSTVTAETALIGNTGAKAFIGTAVENPVVPALGAEDLDSTPSDYSARVRSWELEIINFQNERETLFDGRSNVPGVARREPRQYRFRISIEINDKTESAWVLAQTTKAIELDIDTGVLAGTTTQNYGAHIILPKVRFAVPANAFNQRTQLVQTFDGTLLDTASVGRILAACWNVTTAYAAAA